MSPLWSWAFVIFVCALGASFGLVLARMASRGEHMDQRWLERRWLEDDKPALDFRGMFPPDTGQPYSHRFGDFPTLYDQDDER